MRGKLCSPPPTLCVLAVCTFLGILLGREAFRDGSLPVFLPKISEIIHVELSGARLAPGVYQFNDGLTPRDVIKLTGIGGSGDSLAGQAWEQPLCDGESLIIRKKDREIELLHRGWMTASQRIAMGIPLHPDRMSCEDWTALPGVGAALAAKIENDRQKNGDFGRVDGLKRVPGIGKKRLEQWRVFF